MPSILNNVKNINIFKSNERLGQGVANCGPPAKRGLLPFFLYNPQAENVFMFLKSCENKTNKKSNMPMETICGPQKKPSIEKVCIAINHMCYLNLN